MRNGMFYVLYMKRLNQTESPGFVLLCVSKGSIINFPTGV